MDSCSRLKKDKRRSELPLMTVPNESQTMKKKMMMMTMMMLNSSTMEWVIAIHHDVEDMGRVRWMAMVLAYHD
jgi:heptaprenylglyceryl phosphate synthase